MEADWIPFYEKIETKGNYWMPNNRHIDAFKAFKHTVHYGDHNMFPSSTGLPNKDNKNTIGLPNAYIYF